MSFTRRSMLQGTGYVGVTAALAAAFPTLALANPGNINNDFAMLRSRWVDLITGRQDIDPVDDRFTSLIGKIDDLAEENLLALAPAGSNPVFQDLPWRPDANLVTTARRFKQIAIAWATPGSNLYGDVDARVRTIQGMRDFRTAIYNPDQPQYGNWWTWEIGVTQNLTDAMAIFADHLTADDVRAFCESIDFYVPDPRYQYPPSRGRKVSEGSGRVNLCKPVIIRSIVGEDSERLAHAVAALSEVWQYVDDGNGFYGDGSFLQHGTVPYTGTYGLELLSGLAELFALLAGGNYDLDDPSYVNLLRTVDESFAPLIHEGHMMDSVRGRAISREYERSADNGNAAIGAILLLAEAADDKAAARWRALCRGWIEDNKTSRILDTGSISMLAMVLQLLNSDGDTAHVELGPKFFPEMDRLVYRSDQWTMSLAMCSNRIAWYECGNGENDYGVHTSQGMNYMYLPWDDGHFDDEYWATCDLAGLPGITVDSTTLPPRVEGQWGDSMPENEWTGGVVLGEAAIAGQHLVGPGNTGLRARKSWFFAPNAMVALGADISSESGELVRTVIEHRNVGDETRALVVDGTEVEFARDPIVTVSEGWAHLEGVGGYLFLSPHELKLSLEEREGAWSRNHHGGSTELHRRCYATIENLHSAERTSYAYAILPGADVNRTLEAVDSPPVEVLQNNSVIQAIKAGQTISANFWRASRLQNLVANQPMSLIRRKLKGNEWRIAVSDPTHSQDRISFEVKGNPHRKITGSERVSANGRRGGVEIFVETEGLDGQTVEFSLLGGGA